MIIKAEVEFPNWENRGEGLFDDVVRQAVDQLIDAKRKMLNAAIDKEFTARVSAMFDDYLESEVQPTDKHGKSKGPREKVSDLLLRDIENWFEDRVDSSGHAEGEQRYRCSGEHSSRFSYMIHGLLSSGRYRNVFEDRVKKAAKEIKANLDGQITEAIKLSIKNLVQ